jgi:hypothetical protein
MTRKFSDESEMMQKDGESFFGSPIEWPSVPTLTTGRMYLINETADGGDLVPLSGYLWFRAKGALQAPLNRIFRCR